MQLHIPTPAIGACGYSLREGSPEFDDVGAGLDEAEALGVEVVELPAYAWHLIVDGRILESRLKDLVRALEGRRLGYTIHGALAINLMDLPERLPRHEKVLAANIEIAAAVGARHLVVHAGFVRDPDDDLEVAYSRQRDALARAGDLAAARGVTLCVENIFRFIHARETASPAKLAGELAAIDHPAVKATLDVSHAYIRCTDARLDPIAEMAALAPYVAHFHLHDSFGRPNERRAGDLWYYDPAEAVAFGEGDLHLPIGWGGIDWDSVVQTVRPAPGAIAILELNPRHWRELKDQVEVLRVLAGRFRAELAPVG
ncbi:sugar phosphate isomerase/epimerase [Ancylobacter dichloromethanicus]|uniref:Xylose isomerase n=1 Tax=Ancylobacter dichloromethanicus TaxID=518825 RepID=A0A9W6MZD8_9HYPH|nr:sugar phosphate isomerase/epimerase family protein [Ancylobacter dichloromethanicus]MBS7552633.1 sugar phosphate isomerase/epimerase [Ancylobacter dichloromethanicus]GLK71996.1 xylose isomerase [Ancylobacter dichloromethanicus]